MTDEHRLESSSFPFSKNLIELFRTKRAVKKNGAQQHSTTNRTVQKQNAIMYFIIAGILNYNKMKDWKDE